MSEPSTTSGGERNTGQTQEDADRASPQPPRVISVGESFAKWQQRDQCDRPEHGAHLNSAYCVQVQRADRLRMRRVRGFIGHRVRLAPWWLPEWLACGGESEDAPMDRATGTPGVSRRRPHRCTALSHQAYASGAVPPGPGQISSSRFIAVSSRVTVSA